MMKRRLSQLAYEDGKRIRTLGRGNPPRCDSPLLGIGNLPGGGILAQVGNSCGTTSLSAVMNFFGTEFSPDEIDREIRNFNIYTAPDLIVRFARKHGFESAFINGCTVDELCGFIGASIPVILIVDTRPEERWNPFHLHYVVAISCRGEGEEVWIGIYNPWGLREELSFRELERIWADVRIGPLQCFDRACIPVGLPGSSKIRSRRRGAAGLCALALSGSCAANGIHHVLVERKVFKGLVEIALTLLLLPLGVIGFCVERALDAAGLAKRESCEA